MNHRDPAPAGPTTAAAARVPGDRRRPRWSDGLLLGAVGVIGFSGTAPATRVADPAAVPLLAAAALTRPAAPIPASAWAGLGYVGVISMFAASLAWYRGLAAGGTARIGQLNLAQPFLAVGWSALLLGEHITWAVPVTAAIVLCCMAVCLHSTATRGQTTAPARRALL